MHSCSRWNLRRENRPCLCPGCMLLICLISESKLDNLMEEMKRIWLTLSTVKQDLANVRGHATALTYTYKSVHQPTLVISLLVLIAINNLLLIFSFMSAKRSLRALGRQSDRER